MLCGTLVCASSLARAEDCNIAPFDLSGGNTSHTTMTVPAGSECTVPLHRSGRTIEISQPPGHGAANALSDPAGWSYKPQAGYLGPDTFEVTIKKGGNHPPAILEVSVTVVAVTTAGGSPAAGSPAGAALLDPIDKTYAVVNATVVRKNPDPLSEAVKSFTPGDRVRVVGRLKGADWYLVSDHDKALGYVIADDLIPDSQFVSSAGVQAATAPAPSAPANLSDLDFGNYEALVIGNNDYRNGLPKLKTAASDAKAVALTLSREYGFKVVLLLDATRAQILQALTQFRLTLGWDDNLLIYYAGHGSYDQDGGQGYWLPVDAKPQDPTNWVSNADITTVIKAIPARHVIVVADSCYSGSLTRGAPSDVRDTAYLTRIVQKKARTVMTSGGLEPVSDSGNSGHSIFAQAFLTVLHSNKGIMDAQTFFEKVREPVILAGPQTPEYSALQGAGHDGGDFIFVHR